MTNSAPAEKHTHTVLSASQDNISSGKTNVSKDNEVPNALESIYKYN